MPLSRLFNRHGALFLAAMLTGACGGSPGGIPSSADSRLPSPAVPLSLLDDETAAALHDEQAALTIRLGLDGPADSSGHVARYQGDLWLDDLPVGEFNVAALGGEAFVRFRRLAPGAYTLRYSALTAEGRPVETEAGETVAASGPHHVTDRGAGRGDARFRPARLAVKVGILDGALRPQPRAAGVARVSLPAQLAPWSRGDVIGRLPPLDDEDALLLTRADLHRTASSRFVAVAMSLDGTSSTFLGPVTLSARTDDPLNPHRPTLAVQVLGRTKKLFLDGGDRLVAVSDSGPPLAQAVIQLVDPERLPDEPLVNAFFPFGTPARHYFYLDGNRHVYELSLGPNAGDGLWAATFPDAHLGTIHIQRVEAQRQSARASR